MNYNTDPSVSIPAFFAGRSIFVTGATGFMGKVLLEKLLRSCPDVHEIFLLMRPKKGIAAADRLQKVLSNAVFDRVKKERPSAIKKLIPVNGDAGSESLGLSPVDRKEIIDKVSIIFHAAATVRFNDNLAFAVLTNIRSTRDVCIMAAEMKNLVALVHVSSTFIHTDKPDVEEKIYPAIADWKKIIEIAETVDDHTLNILTPKVLEGLPNTYTFSKSLAEQVINDYADILPAVIVRPSIVVSTINEPVKGWLDNFNGPMGIVVGVGKGVLRVIHNNPVAASDFIPCDIAIKAIISATWKRGISTITKDPSIHVYNLSSCGTVKMTARDILVSGLTFTERIPVEGILWHPNTMMTSNKTLYYFLVLIQHLLPALIIDGILKLAGKSPMLVKLQRKIYTANTALYYFMSNEWTFRNKEFLRLLSELSPNDADTFNFDYANMNIPDYFEHGLIGAKKYLLKEDLSNPGKAKIHAARMKVLDRCVKILSLYITLWLLYRYGYFASIWNYMQGY